MAGSQGAYRRSSIEWNADDLRRALFRRAHFQRAGGRRRRSGDAMAHAGVSRRSIRRLGLRAASALVRGGDPSIATTLIVRLSSGAYHDEQMLALEVLDRLGDIWPEWSAETAALLSRGLRHPWIADRLAQIQARLLSRNPLLVGRHIHWAASQNPLRRRAAALSLLPHRCVRGSRGLRIARALPILRLLLNDPEPHPLVQAAVGKALAYYALRAPRSVARLLRDRRGLLSARPFDRTRHILDGVSSAV
jgi:hypothetical protein